MHVSGESIKYEVAREMCAKSKPRPQKTPNKIIAGIRNFGRRKLNFKIMITRAKILITKADKSRNSMSIIQK